MTESAQHIAPETGERITLPDEAATILLGNRIGAELEAGDLVALHGPIGAGKTALARAILRARLDDPELEAPSPTFTLVQSYDGPKGRVIHADLYRVAGEGELHELGLDDLEEEAAILVEWPERAPSLLDRPRLDISLAPDPVTGGRIASLSGTGALRARLDRARAIETLIEEADWGEARRLPMSGDASTRLYQRLKRPNGETAVLMISPQRPDGPPVRRGKPYSAIARLAESVHAFAAIDHGLTAEGFSAPRILAENLEAGLLLIEDLGPGLVVDENGPIPERYAEAARCLAALHAKKLPTTLAAAEGRDYTIPPYDLDAMSIEIDLLLDWYLPHIGGREASGSVRAEFTHAWREALEGPLGGPQTWTLRDYHSPNLIWLPEREGIERVGIIDFQDAVMGPPAYDVASLLQDARVTVPPELELKLLGLYAATRRAVDPSFDMASFAAHYAIMAAQRATKILGIFARLDRRDGKPAYLKHIPRVAGYLLRNLDHPAMARVKAWYEASLPNLFPPKPKPEQSEGQQELERPREAEAPAEAVVEAEAVPAVDPPTNAPAVAPIDTAMVLAAGLGKRMRPITDTCPKPLVKIDGRTMLDHALDRLDEAGIPNAVVNVHYLADQIERHLASPRDPAIAISDERDALLETGGGVKRALPLLDETFIAMNSDSLWIEEGGSNIARMAANWRPDEMDCLLLLAPRDSLGYEGAGDFHLGPDGRLARRASGEIAPYVYAGVGIFKRESFADTPDGAFSLNLLFDRAIAAGRLYGQVLQGDWLHVGTPEAIPAAEARLAARRAAA